MLWSHRGTIATLSLHSQALKPESAESHALVSTRNGQPNHCGFCPKGSEYPLFKDSGPKNHTLLMAFETRVLKYWVFGPSGCNSGGPMLVMSPKLLLYAASYDLLIGRVWEFPCTIGNLLDIWQVRYCCSYLYSMTSHTKTPGMMVSTVILGDAGTLYHQQYYLERPSAAAYSNGSVQKSGQGSYYRGNSKSGPPPNYSKGSM